MARSQAYRLIEASKVIDNLSPIGDGILPQNESQARALTSLKTIDQRNVWREFVESGTTMNASNIRKFIKTRIKQNMPVVKSGPENRVGIITANYKAAVTVMLEQIRLAQNDHWQNTSKKAALFWLRIMKEKILSKTNRGESGAWQKPLVIEFYDTGSRKMFVLDAHFSESSLNSTDIFSKFLLSTPFPNKKIRFRPDNAKGFLNLKRVINALNIKHSVPGGFYLKPDFSRVRAPKDKVHLESSHRSLHNFEMRIIKFFENRIVKTEPGYVFKKGKKEKITVITLLDIDLEQLRNSGLPESYRRNHNVEKHWFSADGETLRWAPSEKFDAQLCGSRRLVFRPEDVKDFMKYGFDKIKATVSTKGTITFGNRTYHVAVGADNFSRHKSTKVFVSDLSDKLFIFEHKQDIDFVSDRCRGFYCGV